MTEEQIEEVEGRAKLPEMFLMDGMRAAADHEYAKAQDLFSRAEDARAERAKHAAIDLRAMCREAKQFRGAFKDLLARCPNIPEATVLAVYLAWQIDYAKNPGDEDDDGCRYCGAR